VRSEPLRRRLSRFAGSGANPFRLLRSLLPLEVSTRGTSGPKLLVATGYYRLRTRLAANGANVPDINLYRPLFSPWEGLPEFQPYFDLVRPHTLVSPDRCWMLLHLMRHALALPGDFAEFGVFRGGTALLAAEVLREAGDPRAMHLFDSFAGMPETSTGEAFSAGDFDRTSEQSVRALIAPAGVDAQFHVGFIPDTFPAANVSTLAFAHVDVDLYQSVLDCVEFAYPRLVPGGIMIFDDYGFPSCTRSREAADLAFADRREKPIYLPTGQALVIKLP
jgi:O-methyltransferase